MPRTITVQHPEHGELEVEVEGLVPEDEIEEKYISKAAHNAQMAKLRKQTDGQRDPDELLQDPDFRDRAIEAWDIEVDDGTPKLTPDRRQELLDDFKSRHVKPLEQERDQYQEEAQRLRREQLHNKIMSSAAGKVQEHLLKAPGAGQTPPVVNLLAPYFEYDEETGQWAVKDGDSFRHSMDPDTQSPFMGIEEFVGRWVTDDDNPFTLDKRQRGPGAGTPGSGESAGGGSGSGSAGQGGVITLSAEDAKDPAKYRAAREKAEEQGASLDIEEPA